VGKCVSVLKEKCWRDMIWLLTVLCSRSLDRVYKKIGRIPVEVIGKIILSVS